MATRPTPPSNPPGEAISERETSWLVWLEGIYPFDSGRLLLAELTPSGFATPETVFAKAGLDEWEYAAAIGPKRRWVSRIESPSGNYMISVRTAYSDTVGLWHEVARRGTDDWYGTSIAPLTDTTAMLAWAGALGLQVAVLDGATWRPDSVRVDPRPWAAAHPRFRPRPSGGHWLMWSDRWFLRIASDRSGAWAWEDSCICAHAPGETYIRGWLDVSQDAAERPVLAWGDLGYGYTYRDVACAAFPTDSGWAQGVEIPGSENLYTTPSVAVDRNGDAWFAWDILREPIVRWTHTYVKATTSPPSLAGSTTSPRLSWTLSEPAPGSFWAVLRAPEGAEPEVVARLQAGADTLMTWSDTTAPTGSVLHYRIRRESVDRRYEWLSEEATWWPRESALRLEMTGPNPVAQALEFEIVGAAAGPLAVRLYDLQGRAVRKLEAVAQGAGRDAVRLELSSGEPAVRAGMYFLAVRDVTGRTLPVRKVAVVR